MAMKPRPPKPKCKWRRGSGQYYYYEDDKHGYGYVAHRPAVGDNFLSQLYPWYACVSGKKSSVFRLLREAKAWVEKKVGE